MRRERQLNAGWNDTMQLISKESREWWTYVSSVCLHRLVALTRHFRSSSTLTTSNATLSTARASSLPAGICSRSECSPHGRSRAWRPRSSPPSRRSPEDRGSRCLRRPGRVRCASAYVVCRMERDLKTSLSQVAKYEPMGFRPIGTMKFKTAKGFEWEHVSMRCETEA
jgi:hypothetical protein